LRAALERLNPALPPEVITAAVDELTRDRSVMLLEQRHDLPAHIRQTILTLLTAAGATRGP
jgi:hypothetical protein